LNIGGNQEGGEGRSVGNSQTLKETALIEAFNLKAAIEFDMHECLHLRKANPDMSTPFSSLPSPLPSPPFSLSHYLSVLRSEATNAIAWASNEDESFAPCSAGVIVFASFLRLSFYAARS